MHTTYSDGASEVEALVQQAIACGLDAIAITDHDTTASYPFAVEAAKAVEGANIEIIPGIEINTHWEGTEVHVLGYYIDPDDERIQEVNNKHRIARIEQIQEIAELLQKKAKLNITFEDIAAFSRKEGVLGRPHVAQAIVQKGGAGNISGAFDKYLNHRAETYLKRNTVSPHEAVEAIYESGGVAVIAHPREMPMIEDLVIDLMNYGLKGLEAYHKSHTPAMIEFHCTLAEKYGLIVTGGTDFHGLQDVYPTTLSRLKMPDWVHEKLKREHQHIKLSNFKAS
ncbi:MAG: PHP domain-containing protein [Vampirovibrio sp.]|nr:PHP domain-containing protein [Vampirovibrio sp.]